MKQLIDFTEKLIFLAWLIMLLFFLAFCMMTIVYGVLFALLLVVTGHFAAALICLSASLIGVISYKFFYDYCKELDGQLFYTEA